MFHPVWLALGSNLGDRETNLREALRSIETPALHILRVSRVYESAPQGYLEQGWFLNLVSCAETSLTPAQLLATCRDVERKMRRERTIINGPRTIDVDVLFYSREVIQTLELQIPHPRYHQRRFVLQPLADLHPHLRDPVTHLTVEEMLRDVSDQEIRATDIVIEAERKP